MNVGDRFERDGKLIEVTQILPGGYGFKEVKEEKIVFPATEETKEIEEEKPVVRKRAARKKA